MAIDDAVAVRAALAGANTDLVDDVLEPCDLTTLPAQILNELLVCDHHHHHQRVARALQLARDPSSVPFVATALARGFSRLAYTASDDGVIAKWHSWLLADIGTAEAIQVLREYASSNNQEIAAAMTYRLARLHGD